MLRADWIWFGGGGWCGGVAPAQLAAVRRVPSVSVSMTASILATFLHARTKNVAHFGAKRGEDDNGERWRQRQCCLKMFELEISLAVRLRCVYPILTPPDQVRRARSTANQNVLKYAPKMYFYKNKMKIIKKYRIWTCGWFMGSVAHAVNETIGYRKRGRTKLSIWSVAASSIELK